MSAHRIVILPGDGIGPEVTDAAVTVLRRVVDRFELRVDLEQADIGGVAIRRHGDPLPAPTLALARGADAVLLGAVGDPTLASHARQPEAALLELRQELEVFANLRPTRVVRADLGPLRPELATGTNLLIVRELTGGIYFGQPRARQEMPEGSRAIDTMVYSEQEVERVARVAFEQARRRRGRLCSVDKANVLESSRLWREVVCRVALEFPDVEVEHLLVDAAAMRLCRAPASFDVVLTGNLFGDILSDQVSVVPGSIGLGASASLGAPLPGGRRTGLYEPIHGSAPDIAGQGRANPIGAIRSLAMMLRASLEASAAADALDRAIDRVVREGPWTPDLASEGRESASTAEVVQAISARLGSAR